MNQSYYLFSNGELKRKDNSPLLLKEDGSKSNIPIERVRDLYVFSEMTFNVSLLNLLGKYGINVHFFNYYEYYIGSFSPKESMLSGALLVQQVEYYRDSQKRLYLAKEFIKSAAHNIRRNLKYYQNRGKYLADEIQCIDELRERLDDCRTVEEVMGIEGNIRKVYYRAWNEVINVKIDFHTRVKRPPDNMVNSLISFLNSLLYAKVVSEVYKTQLNPTISYLHVPGEKRYSLSLDVSEVFKPILVDRLIFSLLNKKVITESDFVRESDFLKLKESALKRVVKEFEEVLKRTIHHRELRREVSYQYLIRLELYKLIKHLINEKTYKGFEIWW
ncbi:MAG: type I-B CRISPR-associated endonuclease Cas1b [Turicibacter sp.]|nr:type I-B CRISPR-associated endonuclease Cas1b [Turicibacter sp.]